MGSRFPSHQLSNGMYVGGRLEKPKEKPVTMTTAAMPYTGGSIETSGELGKMFDMHVENSKAKKSGPFANAPSRMGSFGGGVSQKPNYGPIKRHGDPIKKSSGPQSGGVNTMSRHNSGAVAPVLPATGLITSGPVSSGPLNSSGATREVFGLLDSIRPVKISIAHDQAVTNLSQDDGFSFKGSFPKPILWTVFVLFVMGFIFGAVQKHTLLIVVVVMLGVVAAIYILNLCYGRRGIVGYIARYPDAELRTAKDGQYVKVSGVVTCGRVLLESSFHKVPRCVYTSTSLYEYRGWNSKPANPQHRRLSWGLRSLERHVVDFYISDSQSGLRALVKSGYGARVTPYVDESTVIDINPNNKDSSPEFLRWLGQKNLSSDDRVMRVKEGYIKEGSIVSVMGVVQRNNNVLMIVPPSEPFSTGCEWAKCRPPSVLEGIVLRGEDTSKDDVIPV